MIFPLIQVKSKIDKIFDVPLVFLENAKLSYECSEPMFPIWFRPVFLNCPGLKDRFENVFKKFKLLKKSNQNQIIDLYRNSREIFSVFDKINVLYPALDQIDKSIQSEIRHLFEFLFNQTIGTDIFKAQSGMHINDHYEEFLSVNDIHVCPFCGLETYTLPKFRRAEYDHFLPISLYPWLGVNFNNLVPMGDQCNGKKNAENVLYKSYNTKSRRLVWYPYDWINYRINLTVISKPTISNMKGVWDVDLKAKNAASQGKIDTWDEIFKIKTRFKEAIAIYHKRFIEDFIHKNSLYEHRLSLTKLKEELKSYKNNGIGDEKIETMAELKRIWADYHIKTTDSTQLAVLVHLVANTKRRPSLLI